MYFADENVKKLPYRRWYRKAAATSEYLMFAGFNELSIVTRRDATRYASQSISRTRRSLYVRFCLSPNMKACLRSTTEIMFAHTSPSCRDLSTGLPRRTAPRCSSRLGRVAWPSRDTLTTPFGLEVKWHEHALVPRLVPTLSNPSTIWIIFSILREATTTSGEAIRLKTFYSSHPDTRLFIFDLILVSSPSDIFLFFSVDIVFPFPPLYSTQYFIVPLYALLQCALYFIIYCTVVLLYLSYC